MGRKYVASFDGVSVSALQDLFEIAAPADAVVLIHGWEIGQITDAGDSNEEILQVECVRGEGSVTSGSGGSTPTARPVEKGDSAFGGSVEANNTTRMAAGSGTLVGLEERAWNTRQGLQVIYPPEMRPVISPSDRWTLSLDDNPSGAITMFGTIWLEEIGG